VSGWKIDKGMVKLMRSKCWKRGLSQWGLEEAVLLHAPRRRKKEEPDRDNRINIGLRRRAKRSYSERARDRGWSSADSEHPWPRKEREKKEERLTRRGIKERGGNKEEKREKTNNNEDETTQRN
jgi:hypothetical protein